MGSTFHSVRIHAIFACKDRRPFITPEIQNRLHEYIAGICRNRNCKLIEGGGVADHAHLLIGLSMTTSISDLMRDIKANTSKWIHEEWPQQEFAWQDGYGAFSVSVSMIDKTRAYIRGQAEHHRKHSLQDELEAFAKMHGMKVMADGSVMPESAGSEAAAPDES